MYTTSLRKFQVKIFRIDFVITVQSRVKKWFLAFFKFFFFFLRHREEAKKLYSFAFRCACCCGGKEIKSFLLLFFKKEALAILAMETAPGP